MGSIVIMRFADFQHSIIPLGFVGENRYKQIRIDCKNIFDEYPSAVPSIIVQPPKGDPYPVVALREGDIVVWDVKSSDLVYPGIGWAQLEFIEGNVVVKSYVSKTRINTSLFPTGDMPTPVENWVEQANAVLGGIPTIIETSVNSALEQARDTGMFDGRDGEDGVSPVIGFTTIVGGHRLTIVDKLGTQEFDILDGTPGEPGLDGISPEVTITDIAGGHTITITDQTGSHSFNVMDGAKGDSGDPTELIDDLSTSDFDKTWSANKLHETFQTKVNEPNQDGTNGQVLATDGHGGRFWVDVQGGTGFGAVSIRDTIDQNGGIIREINAVDLSNDTVSAEHLEEGYTAHDSEGNPVRGTMTGGALLPSGGYQGSLLAKRTDNDGDVEWIEPATSAEQDNTRPITAAAVYTEIGNINALLATI